MTEEQKSNKLPPLPIPRQIHRDLKRMKDKFLDKDGNPRPGTDAETVEFIRNLEKDLEAEAVERHFEIPIDPTKSPTKIGLKTLLDRQPELAAKLLEALETDRFFITVTFQKKYKPEDQHDLHHYFCRRQFMQNDVLPSMRQIANDFKAKEMPNAEIQSDDWI